MGHRAPTNSSPAVVGRPAAGPSATQTGSRAGCVVVSLIDEAHDDKDGSGAVMV